MNLADIIPVAITSGLMASGATIWVQWLRSGSDTYKTNRTVSADLEKHWTHTTLELVDAFHQELKEAKSELSALRPMAVRLAHFEEALDHIRNLISAETEKEKTLADNRARDFLHRMGWDERQGQRRAEEQSDDSADELVAKIKRRGK